MALQAFEHCRPISDSVARNSGSRSDADARNYAARRLVLIEDKWRTGSWPIGSTSLHPSLRPLWDLENELRKAAQNAIFRKNDAAKQHLAEARRHYDTALKALMGEVPAKGTTTPPAVTPPPPDSPHPPA